MPKIINYNYFGPMKSRFSQILVTNVNPGSEKINACVLGSCTELNSVPLHCVHGTSLHRLPDSAFFCMLEIL